jgi:hypothetical protein
MARARRPPAQTPPREQPPPRAIPPGEVAAALGIAGATAGTAAPVVAGVVAEKQVADATANAVAALTRFFRTKRKDDSIWLTDYVRREFPQRTTVEVEEIVSGEMAREIEFQARARARLERDLPKALREPDREKRMAAVNKLLDRERRYVGMRADAMRERAAARAEHRDVRNASPSGAYWLLDPTKKSHTAGCLLMAQRGFWPWQVLDHIHPTLHSGCGCQLLSLADAQRRGLIPEGFTPDVRDAVASARSIISRVSALEEATTPEEREAWIEYLLDEARYEEFEHPRGRGGQWIGKGVRKVKSFHITDNPKFKLDPKRVGQINSTIGGEMNEPGIFVTKNVEFWVNRHDYVRPFVAEIEHPEEVATGYYSEADKYLPARLYDQSKVTRVIPLDEWVREHYQSPGWIEEHHGTDIHGNPLPDYRKGERFPPDYRYTGPDVRDMPPEEVQRHFDRATRYIETSDRKYSMLRTFDDSGEYAVDERGRPVFGKWKWAYDKRGKRLQEARAHNPEYERETVKIKQRAETPEAKARHSFRAAKWTHPNGHPRCALCGQEEQVGGICNGKPTKAEAEAWAKRENRDGMWGDSEWQVGKRGELTLSLSESERDEIAALVRSLKRPCDCGADNLPHEYGSACPEDGPVALQEARWQRRFPKGAEHGGEFAPRNAVAKLRRSVRDLLSRELPSVPLQERGKPQGRYVWLRGRYVFVPRNRAFTRKLDGVEFHSPAGSTNIYREGQLVQIEGQPAPPHHHDLNPPRPADIRNIPSTPEWRTANRSVDVKLDPGTLTTDQEAVIGSVLVAHDNERDKIMRRVETLLHWPPHTGRRARRRCVRVSQ